jgi:hypothetical protein
VPLAQLAPRAGVLPESDRRRTEVRPKLLGKPAVVLLSALGQPLETPGVEVVVDEILGGVFARTLLLGRRLVAFEELEAVRFALEALRLPAAAKIIVGLGFAATVESVRVMMPMGRHPRKESLKWPRVIRRYGGTRARPARPVLLG